MTDNSPTNLSGIEMILEAAKLITEHDLTPPSGTLSAGHPVPNNRVDIIQSRAEPASNIRKRKREHLLPMQAGNKHDIPEPPRKRQVASGRRLASATPSNKTKMIHGQCYATDAEVLLERQRCELACKSFNRWETERAALSEMNLRLFLQVLCLEHPQSPSLHRPAARLTRLGRDVSVQKPFFCHYGYNISIGDFVEIGPSCEIHDACRVTIGEQCSIAANVTIISDLPVLDPGSRRLGSRVGKPISIGPYCYIGQGATIMPGCVIGMGSFIYPGAVVSAHVPPYAIFAGNLARQIGDIRRGLACHNLGATFE